MTPTSKYSDGSTIDWLAEESLERERRQNLKSYQGLRRILAPLYDSASLWFVIIVTGIGVGVIGGWLDVLVEWLSDLREGRCTHGFLYNQPTCCSGLDPGEICIEWQTWSQWMGVKSIFAQSLLQSFVYIALAVAFAVTAAFLVVVYAPHAFHTGIPEIKAIIGGYVFDAFLSPWTLLIKSLGLALSVASGLSLGKEGPLVHVSCCTAYLLLSLFKNLNGNEAHKRRVLAAAAAAGISVAFGSPLGGVLFGLEELDTFANEPEVIWRAFVTSVIAAVSLQYIDPFGTSKLVLFQVSGANNTWRAFELVPWLILSVIGGVLGSFLIKLNVLAETIRQNTPLIRNPILEVAGVAAVTSTISYLVVFMRVQSSQLVANLFQDCVTTTTDYHGLCNPTAMTENVFLLFLTAGLKLLLTAWTFGLMVPAGIFLPTIAIGASLGRAVGLLTQQFHRAYPTLSVFNSCPPDLSTACISPGFYAVIGASAMLGGVTRMTISLVVILFELTGALSHVLPIMISVMVSKWVADALGREGIYPTWIALHKYPWIPSVEYKDQGETAAELMIPYERIVTIKSHDSSVGELIGLLRKWNFVGFPLEDQNRRVLGFVTREDLQVALDPYMTSNDPTLLTTRCTFDNDDSDQLSINLSSAVSDIPFQLRKEVPQQHVVRMFQKMNVRYIIFSDRGHLTGLVTKSNVVRLLTPKLMDGDDLLTQRERINELLSS